MGCVLRASQLGVPDGRRCLPYRPPCLQAAERLAGLGALLGRFPTLLRDLIPSLQMLLGGW